MERSNRALQADVEPDRRGTEGAAGDGHVHGSCRVGPISWGICEVPGWGAQLPVERVLTEMVSLELTATELGSVGYLPTDPTSCGRCSIDTACRLTGGFNALVLHDDQRTDAMLDQARAGADLLAAAGAESFVTCAVSDPDDWHRPTLGESEWQTMYANIARRRRHLPRSWARSGVPSARRFARRDRSGDTARPRLD